MRRFWGLISCHSRGAEVVNVLVDLTGAEPVALLDEGVLCPRCVQLHLERRRARGQEARIGSDSGGAEINEPLPAAIYAHKNTSGNVKRLVDIIETGRAT